MRRKITTTFVSANVSDKIHVATMYCDVLLTLDQSHALTISTIMISILRILHEIMNFPM